MERLSPIGGLTSAIMSMKRTMSNVAVKMSPFRSSGVTAAIWSVTGTSGVGRAIRGPSRAEPSFS